MVIKQVKRAIFDLVKNVQFLSHLLYCSQGNQIKQVVAVLPTVNSLAVAIGHRAVKNK